MQGDPGSPAHARTGRRCIKSALPFFGASIPGFVGLLTGRGPFSPAFALIPGRSIVLLSPFQGGCWFQLESGCDRRGGNSPFAVTSGRSCDSSLRRSTRVTSSAISSGVRRRMPQQPREDLPHLRHRDGRGFPPRLAVVPGTRTTTPRAPTSCGDANPPNCAPRSDPAPPRPCRPRTPPRSGAADAGHRTTSASGTSGPALLSA